MRRLHGESSQSTFRILRGKAKGAQTSARSRDLPGNGARQRAHRLRQGVEICPGMGQGRGRSGHLNHQGSFPRRMADLRPPPTAHQPASKNRATCICYSTRTNPIADAHQTHRNHNAHAHQTHGNRNADAHQTHRNRNAHAHQAHGNRNDDAHQAHDYHLSHILDKADDTKKALHSLSRGEPYTVNWQTEKPTANRILPQV